MEGEAPQAPPVSGDPLAEQVYEEFRAAFQVLAQDIMAQAIREVVVPMNPNVGIVATRVRDFNRMNPAYFHGSKVEKYSQEFIDEVYKVLMIIVVTPMEKAELAAYKLKGVAQVWFNQWKEERGKSHSKKYLMGTNNCFVVARVVTTYVHLEMKSERIVGRIHLVAQVQVLQSKTSFMHFKLVTSKRVPPDVVSDMLKVFHLDVYAFLDPTATLSFMTPYVAMRLCRKVLKSGKVLWLNLIGLVEGSKGEEATLDGKSSVVISSIIGCISLQAF
uniref:Gag-pol polyprotein n=1 Tax=Solanum tuberosum TaxID=4113 RepID=M1DJY6_SOLTU